jgi:hypothetical protein
MKSIPALVIAAVVLLSTAASSLAEGRTEPVAIELTEDQVAIIIHNCPRNEQIAIELTEDQISIIVHNFPQVEIEELILGRENIGENNIVELVADGRTGVTPLTRGE